MTKPFDIQELLARITVQLRKALGWKIGWMWARRPWTPPPFLWKWREGKLTRTEGAILKLLEAGVPME